jgi:3',5'-cyclic AMP phosphodiesterase CpdA
MHLELVTVSDTRAVFTWFTGDPGAPDEFGRPAPVAAPGRVLIGTSPDPRSWEPIGSHRPTAYHYVEVAGLRPGTTYYWRAESNGVEAIPTGFSPYHLEVAAPPSFTTLRPPPGRALATVAWLNDLHIGEHTSGLAISDDRLPRGGFPPGFPVDPEDPYWRTMARAAVTESADRGCRLLLANGDLTNEAEPAALREARRTLDAFGTLGRRRAVTSSSPPTYFVTRGNHDRAHSGTTWGSCRRVPGRPDLRDCFLDTFGDGFDRGTTRFSVTVGDEGARYRFVGLDSNKADDTGVMPQAELDYFEAQLERGDATIALCHHPVADVALYTGVVPGAVGVEPAQAARFRELIARYDNVAGVYNGHTHRNYRTVATDTGTVPYFEGGAVKEYPGGYTTVRLYEGGYMVNFWKTKDPAARAWSELSRGEYLGLYPYYTLGSFGDRNWVHTFDASRRRSRDVHYADA